METDRKYQLLLRRELVRAQARLKRAEQERDDLRHKNELLRRVLREHGIEPPNSMRGGRAMRVRKHGDSPSGRDTG